MVHLPRMDHKDSTVSSLNMTTLCVSVCVFKCVCVCWGWGGMTTGAGGEDTAKSEETPGTSGPVPSDPTSLCPLERFQTMTGAVFESKHFQIGRMQVLVERR